MEMTVEERRPSAAADAAGAKRNTMGHKRQRHGPAPVPPANQSHMGPGKGDSSDKDKQEVPDESTSASQEQDPKRRFGDYESAGGHPYVQPGGLNDANH